MKLSKLTKSIIRPVPECLKPIVQAIEGQRGVTLAIHQSALISANKGE